MIFSIVFLLLISSTFGEISKIANLIPPCRKTDEKLNECLKDSFNKVRENIAKGVREVNLAPLEPFYVEGTIAINATNGYQVRLKDIFMYGQSKLIFTEVRSNIPKLKFEMKFMQSKVKAKSRYEINGNYFQFAISGMGRLSIVFENVTGIMRVFGKRVTRNNEDYMDIERVIVNLNVPYGRYRIDDDINPELSEFYTNLANSNMKTSINSGMDEVKRRMALNLKEIFQSVYSTVPINAYLTD